MLKSLPAIRNGEQQENSGTFSYCCRVPLDLSQGNVGEEIATMQDGAQSGPGPLNEWPSNRVHTMMNKHKVPGNFELSNVQLSSPIDDVRLMKE